MAKYYMDENIFSNLNEFWIKNELEEDCYRIHGDYVVIGSKKLHIDDMSGREVAMIQQKILSLLPKFFVYQNGEQVAEIVKKISFFKAKYVVSGPNWDVQGSILDHDYTILDHGREIVRIHKVWLTWGDCFEIEIDEGVDEGMALAVVLAIDCVMQAEVEASQADHDEV